MIFQHTIDKVLSGEKVQTRRICKPDDYGWMCGYYNDTQLAYSSVHTTKEPKHITRFVRGKTYAAQPGRGKKAVARIEITGIRREDVREISDVDVMAEGFNSKLLFLLTWASMHDKKTHDYIMNETVEDGLYALSQRPSERYTAWALTFKLVDGAR